VAQITALSQRDPRWINSPLGDATIGTDGCLITSLASLLGLTPPEVVNRLNSIPKDAKGNTGLVSGKLVYWSRLPEAFPGMTQHRVWSFDEQLATSQLPTLLEVDFDGTPRTDNKHWVVLINKDTIMDPWTGTIESASKYPLKTGFCLVVIPQGVEKSTFYKGLDLTNAESMKVAIDTWERVKNGELVDKGQFQSQAEAAAQCQVQLKTALEQVSDYQNRSKELEGWLNTTKAELKEVKLKYEDEQRLVISLKSEIEEIHKQDKNYGQEALDAQHKYSELKEGIERIGQEMDLQYDSTDDKTLVDEILHEIANRDQQQAPTEQNDQLHTILRLLDSMGINNYLQKRGIQPIDFHNFDQDLEQKVATYLTDLANELIALSTPEKPTQTPVADSVKTPRKNFFSSLLSPFIKLLFQPSL